MVLSYKDGSTRGQVLHRGDDESCERVVYGLPAVADSTGEVVAASLRVLSEEEWVRWTTPETVTP